MYEDYEEYGYDSRDSDSDIEGEDGWQEDMSDEDIQTGAAPKKLSRKWDSTTQSRAPMVKPSELQPRQR